MSRRVISSLITSHSGMHIVVYVQNNEKHFSFTSHNGFICLDDFEVWRLHWCLNDRRSERFGHIERQVTYRMSGENFELETDEYGKVDRITLEPEDIQAILSSDLLNYLKGDIEQWQ